MYVSCVHALATSARLSILRRIGSSPAPTAEDEPEDACAREAECLRKRRDDDIAHHLVAAAILKSAEACGEAVPVRGVEETRV